MPKMSFRKSRDSPKACNKKAVKLKKKNKQVIIDAMQIKPEQHEFDLTEQPIIMRHMNSTGG
jgi:hypothetical protein